MAFRIGRKEEAVIKSGIPPINKNVQWIDTVNKVIKIWNEEMQSWTSMGNTIAQKTKLGVEASLEIPYTFEFLIEGTDDLKRPPVEVLAFTVGGLGETHTICNFDNSDGSNFLSNENVVFEGKMKLRTKNNVVMLDEGLLGSGKLFGATIDMNKFNNIKKIEVI